VQSNLQDDGRATSAEGAKRAYAPLGSRGVRYISETADTPRGAAVIASVSDQEWTIARTYGMYRIPPCGTGESCTVLEVLPRTDAIDLGDNRKMPLGIPARKIAEDIVQELDRHGVFVCEGSAPTEEELRGARAKREKWFHELLQEADMMWARGHTYREISDMHRRAALALNMEREWSYVPGQRIDCPMCGETIKATVAVCRHCGAVLDPERAAKHGLGPDSARRIGAGQGRAPAEEVHSHDWQNPQLNTQKTSGE
jgi:hypothetical protein